jgi:dTDP-4-amino-4,6-dideoxygalactose transaminase/acetyltransferase-like isoleucine patch superfamily enzyme
MSSTFVHPTAVIDERVEIGPETKIWHFVHVSPDARIGARCSLGQGCFVGRGVRLGDGVRVQNNVSIYEGVDVEDDAFLGPSCVFTNVLNPRSFVSRKHEYRPTRVGRGASIGANAVIVCGHDIGEYAFVGAGAVVTKDVPPYALVVGNPARRIGWMSRVGARLPDGADVVCPESGERYRIEGERCVPVDGPTVDEGPIPLLDLAAQNGPLRAAIDVAMGEVVRANQFIMGPQVAAFEREIAAALGVSHAIGVSSGTDALLVALMALDVGAGDEVITTPFSFFATAGVIHRVGATPVFVDIDPATFNLDPAQVADRLTERTKAILPVHLFGQPCDMAALRAAAPGVPIVEDAAQTILASTEQGPVGALGELACFSFFPSKNLGAFGDGGLVTTDDDALAEKVRRLRLHGSHPKYFHAMVGGNFRLDTLQAAVLRVKLPHLPAWTEARRANAARYDRLFAEAGLADVVLPLRVVEGHVYNQYTLRVPRRDDLAKHLAAAKVGHAIYYPLPLHLQGCFAHLGHREGDLPEAERACREVISIPVYPELGEMRQRRVVEAIAAFYR